MKNLPGIPLILLLCACTVGPTYRQPDLPVNEHYQTPARDAGADPQGVDLDQWWRGFGDPVLTRIVGHVLDQNLDLAAAEARVRWRPCRRARGRCGIAARRQS